jgi:hypothetical protein
MSPSGKTMVLKLVEANFLTISHFGRYLIGFAKKTLYVYWNRTK